MRFSNQEKSPHSQFGEQQSSNEFSRYGETQNQCENFSSGELHPTEEIPLPNKDNTAIKKGLKNQTDGQKTKQLTQFLSSVAVLFTATVAVILPATSPPTEPPPLINLVQEYVGCDRYSCLLDVTDDEQTLSAVLKTVDGEIITQTDVEHLPETELSFGELVPETEYVLTVFDEQGETEYEGQFTTDPFIYLTEQPELNRISYLLHEDLSGYSDTGLGLYSSDGREFGSNIVYSPADDLNYITLAGLYADWYTLKVTCHPLDGEPMEFWTEIELGELEKLAYTASYGQVDSAQGVGYQLVLNYQLGDLLPYETIEVDVKTADYSQTYYYSAEDLTVGSDNTITIALAEQIADGTYTIDIWGQFTDGEVGLYNQIWTGEIEITNTI